METMYHSAWKVSEGYYINMLGRVFIKGWNWNYNIIYKNNLKNKKK